jgi:uncharacterized LabA/DUF88 family protein
MSSTTTRARTIVYIDGFNLYFGLVEQGWRRYLWLDLSKFATAILSGRQRLVKIKYFTSRISGPPEKQERQNAYLKAIKTLDDVQVIEGRYQSDRVVCRHCNVQIECPKCRVRWFANNEKMTDVNIAVQMMSDSYRNQTDELLLVTGDADQRPAIERVGALFGKPVHVCFPPKRKSYDLEKAATSCFWAPEEAYRKSQFPVVVDIPGGFTVTKPSTWNRK